MSALPEHRRFWRTLRALGIPLLLWALLVAILVVSVRARLHGDEEYDEAALREWVEESRNFHETLPEMVRHYLDVARPASGQHDQLTELADKIHDHLEALCDPTKMYQGQLPLFPAIYRLELEFRTGSNPPLAPIVWESEIPRPRRTTQIRQLEYALLGPADDRARLRFEYQMHAYNRRQRDEQAANSRLRWVFGLAITATVLAFLWISLVQGQERERERQRTLALHQVGLAERLLLEGELRRQEAERLQEEAERKLLEQRLATQAAEGQALELKSQLYASIGIMAGSYAHNIKNLLVRPNDLLRRCLQADGLSPDQGYMLREVRQTLGMVTERLQQILHTVRRDPSRSELVRLDLNTVVRDLHRTWADLAGEKWKLALAMELNPEPLWIEGDLSHLQQAAENLLFNARDATFEMRSHLRDEARLHVKAKEERPHLREEQETPTVLLRTTPSADDSRQALIAAAAWKGTVILRTRQQGKEAILEVQDNGIGMSEEVRRRCTETHFSTKRNNAIYEGNTTGMGLGLSFVVAILDHHRASLEIEAAPLQGALLRVRLPLHE